ncbi:DUF2089 domain-containing protein [Alicyclobacillus tolerans]|uniref:DUF2089 domain-containing protein n=1 Tax=Alicyclobacillus tolerans TaxID=90970 RepID=UPI001F2874D3|nr:DUF2089 domain-containing protein [Alicyclobacillus tolerans]MCF8565774.1 DUF2089 domain-containing protein [Alicyclobacillus tolerans]
MPYPIPFVCPACQEQMYVSELTCPHCMTKVQGAFEASGLHRLTPEQLKFVEVFLRCRGNIKEVERDLKVSYPTVRSKLDQIIHAMGYSVPVSEEEDDSKTSVLDALGSGELTFEEALDMLKGDTSR